jgi:hypothetical protein
MKKLLTASLLAMLSVSVYAQGLVSINEFTYTITTNTIANGGASGKLSSTASSYYFELLTLADPTGSTTLPTLASSVSLLSWADSGVSGTNATGINAGKIAAVGAIPGVSVANWAPGATNFTIVVGWSAAEGSTWATVSQELASNHWTDQNGVIGWSSVGYLAAAAINPGGTVFGAQAGGISSGFALTPVVPTPEPTTMALAALGGAAMLLIRRKK